MSALTWDSLSESARTVIAYQAHVLANGFTGRLVLDISEGGIRNCTEEQVVERRADGSRKVSVHSYTAEDLRQKMAGEIS